MTIVCPLPQDIGFNSNLYKITVKIPDVYDSIKRKLEKVTINDTQNKNSCLNNSSDNKSELNLQSYNNNEKDELHILKKQRVTKYQVENILKRKFDLLDI